MRLSRHRTPPTTPPRPPRRWIRRLGWTLASLGCVLILTHSLLYFGLAHYKIREQVEADLSREWGYPVTIARLRLGVFLNRIVLTGIRVTEPNRPTPLLRLPTLRLNLDLSALLSRTLTVSRISLSAPDADVEIAPDGSSPFLDLFHHILTPPKTRRLLTPAISEVRIRNGTVRLRLPHRPLTISLRDVDARISLTPDRTFREGTLTMAEARIETPSRTRSLTRISARASLRGTTLTLSSAEAHLGKSSLVLSGSIHSFATSPLLDLQARLSLHPASLLLPPPPSLPESLEMRGTITGPLTALQVEGTAPLLSGVLRTAGSLTREDDEWAYRLTLTARDLGLPALLALALPCAPLPTVRGTLDGELTLQGTGGDLTPSQGNGWVKSNNLILPHAPAPATVESSFHLASPQWILDTFRLAVPGSHREGIVEIRGTMGPDTSHLSVRAREVDLQLLRSLDTLSDLDGLLNFTGVLDGRLTAPQVRGDLVVRNLTRGPVAIATVTGTIAHPEGEGRLTARDLTLWGEPWREGSARFTFSGDELTLSHLFLRHGEPPAPEQVEAQGTLRFGGPLDLTMTASRLDLSRMEARERFPLSGQAHLTASLTGTVIRPILHGTFSLTDVRYKNVPLGEGEGSLSLSPERIQGEATFSQGGYRGTAEVEREGKKNYRLTVTFDEANLAPLLVFIDHPLFEGATGRATGTLTLAGEQGVKESARGEAHFTLLELNVRGDHLVNTHPVTFTLSEGRLQFTDFQMAGGEKRVTVQGDLVFGQEWDLTLTGQLGLGLLRAFLPTVEKASGMGRLSLLIRGYWDAPDLTGSLDVENGEIHLENVVPPLKNVRAHTTFTRETTLLDPFEATVGDGALSATLRSDGQGSHTRHTLTLKLVGAGADQVLRGKEREGAVTGRLTLTASLTAQGRSAPEIQRSLAGRLSLVLEDGRIRRYVTLAKIYSLLKISSDVFTRGIRYTTWTGDFALSQGVMETTNLFLEANTLRATTVGAINIPERTLDLTVAIHPFPTLGSVIGNIPLLGYLLTGENKSVLTATFAVSGPWSDPQVSDMGIQTLGQGLLDLLKGAFRPSTKTEPPLDAPPPETTDD